MEQMLQLLERRQEMNPNPFHLDLASDPIRYDSLGVVSRSQNEFSSGLHRKCESQDFNSNNSKKGKQMILRLDNMQILMKHKEIPMEQEEILMQ